MFRTFLIVAAALLGVGSAIFASTTAPRPDMRRLLWILIGVDGFFVFFFTGVRIIDNYYNQWLAPAIIFVGAAYAAFLRLEDIKRKIMRTAAINAEEIDWADLEEPFEHDSEALFDEPRPRRFLDDYFVADEADLGPTQLELDRLDDFIFTSRHGYLVHDRGGDETICDVMTIVPGMSIADLISVAKQHECAGEPTA